MYKDKRILVVIPARGGSKGLPGKNIRQLIDKPLIAWSINHAQDSKYVDEIFVSTDSREIATVAEQYNVKVPFLRPQELSGDTASSMDVILHTIDTLEKQNKSFDIVIMVEPTSPLREPIDIDNSIEMLVETYNAESVVGICEVEGAHPDFLVELKNNFLVPYVNKDFTVKRRQDIMPMFFFEGTVYTSFVNSIKKRKNFYHEKTLGYVVPKWKSYEVDDISDFVIIEAILKARNSKLIK
jgi:N-acylneuraminate cytidylyltransferase/CMP-N,N'-diacetyllegionaminic acid synthase